MADEEISKLHEILSIILDEIRSAKKAPTSGPLDGTIANNWPFLADIERVYVAQVLRHTRGNKQAAARILNVDRKTLDRMIKRHKLNLPEIQTAP
jgi:DNA-binding NtrC family response regulator